MSNITVPTCKILTLWQPWASAIASGLKAYETRSWGTTYRGPLLIHAAKRKPRPDELQHVSKVVENPDALVRDLGCVVAIAELTNCLRMTDALIQSVSAEDIGLGWWVCDRFAWKLENVVALSEPVPCRGMQGLRKADPKIAAQCFDQLNLSVP